MPRKIGPHTEFLKSAIAKHQIDKEQDKSVQWLRDKVVKIAHGDGDLKVKQAFYSRRANKVGDGPTNRPRLGNLYMVRYHAKYEKELPYWDAFPLIIPFSYRPKHILAINLHYLPPRLRVALFDKIREIFELRGKTDETKYKLTIGMINTIKTWPEFGPCVKLYLNDHFRSLFEPVPPEEWNYVSLLDSSAFQKASKYKVWQDSLAAMGMK
ncbi:DNA end protector protein [Caulobacter phage Cr30]|uniref:DNA end protector n=1 Tax=Caulobacter phage Cr30 TaxID=1357714 RepID=UPI0004A9B733|nr:DNA end protector [Caulobacter phage Cr30]AGS81129.1 DNA end protector protein [Caulobacter phage Cr30]